MRKYEQMRTNMNEMGATKSHQIWWLFEWCNIQRSFKMRNKSLAERTGISVYGFQDMSICWYGRIWIAMDGYGRICRPLYTKWVQQKVTKFNDFSGGAILRMGGYAQIWADVFRYGDMSRYGPIWTKWAQQKVTKFGDFRVRQHC